MYIFNLYLEEGGLVITDSEVTEPCAKASKNANAMLGMININTRPSR